MKTKKAFREYLNEQELAHRASAPEHVNTQYKNGVRGQRVRLYGDYLYSQDREMFNVEFANWTPSPTPVKPKAEHTPTPEIQRLKETLETISKFFAHNTPVNGWALLPSTESETIADGIRQSLFFLPKIVLACNAHEELVGLLHESANLIAMLKPSGARYPLVERITQAIAHAERE